MIDNSNTAGPRPGKTRWWVFGAVVAGILLMCWGLDFEGKSILLPLFGLAVLGGVAATAGVGKPPRR